MTEHNNFRILTVCTGNICRSPAVERTLREVLGGAITVESAGTHAVVGAPIEPPMAVLLRKDGVSTEAFRARQLTEAMINEADLILPLTREHRAWIVEEVPGALQRTFTLLEFAQVAKEFGHTLEAGPSLQEGLAALTEEGQFARPNLALSGEERDVPDPYGCDGAAYDLAYGLISEAVIEIGLAVTESP